MSSKIRFVSRALAGAFSTIVVTLPAEAQSQASHRNKQGGAGGAFSAPEIDLALISSALLVAGGSALILRDRKARRDSESGE